jgi:hypothetical protein
MFVCNEEDIFHKFRFFETCGEDNLHNNFFKTLEMHFLDVGNGWKEANKNNNLEEEGEFTAIGASLGFKISDILQFCFDLQQKKHHPSSFFLLLLLRLKQNKKTQKPESTRNSLLQNQKKGSGAAATENRPTQQDEIACRLLRGEQLPPY